jgi:hypothetical protein
MYRLTARPTSTEHFSNKACVTEGLGFGALLSLSLLGRADNMGKKFLLLIPIFLLALLTGSSLASEQRMFELTNEGSITATVVNAPLQEVLKNFCSIFDLEVKGMPGIDALVSLTITKGTFDETLKRLLRGYNYVYMQDATSGKPAIMVFGKAERTKYVDAPPPSRAVAEPMPSPTPLPPSRQSMTSALSPAPRPVQGAVSSPKTTATELQKPQAEEEPGSVVASARPVSMPSPANSTVPPIPPQIPGLEMPPIPPSLEEAKAASVNVVGENSSGQASLETPPEIPAGGDAAQPKPKPKADLKDLAPPSMPF